MAFRILSSLFTAIVAAAFVSGCSLDLEAGAQLPGQECTEDSHCADDLICVERRCRYTGTGVDAGVDDADDVADGEPDSDDGNDFNVNDNDPLPPECTPGETRCISPSTSAQCIIGEGGQGEWMVLDCVDGQTCVDGACVDDPDVCCAGGCGASEICHHCSCTPYDSSLCEYQNQPCDTEGQNVNGFVCADLGSGGGLRCIGMCSPGAPDPDATCPEEGSVCNYESSDDPTGWCLLSCNIGDICSDSRMACYYNAASSKEGICLPATGLGQEGDSCDGDDFYNCAGEHMCIQDVCYQTCRPFGQFETDCAADRYCVPFDDNWGFCLPDSSIDDNNCAEEFTTCGEDATICAPGMGGQLRCYDFCRLALGDDDCSPGSSCSQHDPDNPSIGICNPGFGGL